MTGEYIPLPTVETICQNKRYNFTLKIRAYRKLSDAEAQQVYRAYLSAKGLTHPPQNVTVVFPTTHGYSGESIL